MLWLIYVCDLNELEFKTDFCIVSFWNNLPQQSSAVQSSTGPNTFPDDSVSSNLREVVKRCCTNIMLDSFLCPREFHFWTRPFLHISDH